MKRRILLVDDELAILLTLKAILEMNGFEVETADSADNAIEKLGAAEYNMVITDLRMERETSGFDVIRFAKKQAYNPATAILTAFPTLGNNWQPGRRESATGEAGGDRRVDSPAGIAADYPRGFQAET